MLPSENRLKANEFDKVKEHAKLLQEGDFAVLINRRKDGKKSKFGVVVSKKISSIAVHRNRIKRAIFEACRRNIYRVPTGYDMIFLSKTSIGKRMTDEIMKEIEEFLKSKFK